MDQAVREMDVCVHLPSRRRCLVVWAGEETARCVYDDDHFFDCRMAELVPYRHPKFAEAVRLARSVPTRRD